MKLAAGVARTVDVEGMLDAITEQELREWMAFDSICPIGPERWDRPVAEFMAIVCRYLAGLAGEKPELIDQLEPERFCPWLVRDEEEADEPMDDAQIRANMESALLFARAGMRSHAG